MENNCKVDLSVPKIPLFFFFAKVVPVLDQVPNWFKNCKESSLLLHSQRETS